MRSICAGTLGAGDCTADGITERAGTGNKKRCWKLVRVVMVAGGVIRE